MNATVTNISLSHNVACGETSHGQLALAAVVNGMSMIDMAMMASVTALVNGCSASTSMISDWTTVASTIHGYCVRPSDPIIT